jgi:tetratricopeptide (TPR) repeat protein
MALFNRALLEDRTGDLKSAIRDYSIVIKQFPNFWTGRKYRADCYRRLGQTANAEKDEYRILKAQMDKHLGVQNRWSSAKLQQMRKLSDIDPNKYDQIVVEDEASTEPEYKSEYRGKIQNRQITEHYQPYIVMEKDSLVEKTEYPEIKEPKTAQDYYNLGTRQARETKYAEAIENLTKAIEIDSYFSQAYYNRGLAYLHSEETEKSQADLSKAGELGLYSAYSLMKQNNKKNKKK